MLSSIPSEHGLLPKLCGMIPRFLLFLFELMLLVTSWVSPSTTYVIAAVCTMVKDDPVTYFVVLPKIFRRTRLCPENPLKILAALLRQKNSCTLVLAVEAREGPNTQDKAGRFMAATGHHFEDVMANCHPLGIAEEVAGKIVQHPVSLPTALEEIRGETSPARPQQCVRRCRRCCHSLVSSVLSSPSV